MTSQLAVAVHLGSIQFDTSVSFFFFVSLAPFFSTRITAYLTLVINFMQHQNTVHSAGICDTPAGVKLYSSPARNSAVERCRCVEMPTPCAEDATSASATELEAPEAAGLPKILRMTLFIILKNCAHVEFLVIL